MKNLTTLALLWLLALAPALAQTFETRPLPAFTALEVSSGIELRLTSGPAQKVQAEADNAELLARIKTEVKGTILKVYFESSLGKSRKSSRLRVNVTAAGLRSLQASGGSSLLVQGTYPATDLTLQASSGAALEGAFQASSISASSSSGAMAKLSGNTQRLTATASSGATLNAGNLTAAECKASASSGAGVRLNVQKTLTAQASSGGGIRYAGSPKVSKQTSSGGSVSAM